MQMRQNSSACAARVGATAALAIAFMAAAGASHAQEGTLQACRAATTPDAMIAACTRVIDTAAASPADLAVAHLIRGAAKRDKRDLDGAIADETAALALDPKLADAHVIRGILYILKKDNHAALRDFDALLQAEPRNAVVLGHRSAVYMQTKQYANAIRDFDELLRQKPQAGEIHYQRGMAHRLLGQHEQALRDFETAVRLTPDNALAITDLAIAYLDGLGVAKDKKRAAELLDRAAKLGFAPAKQMLERVNAGKP
jgi:tetratricopeptide (TPR) repeat protein